MKRMYSKPLYRRHLVLGAALIMVLGIWMSCEIVDSLISSSDQTPFGQALSITVKFTAAENTALDQDVDGMITGNIVTVFLPQKTGESITQWLDTDLTSLQPEITLAGYSSIFPVSGVAQNLSFNNEVDYTAMKADGTADTYTVRLRVKATDTNFKGTGNLMKTALAKFGDTGNYNFIDVSDVTDMNNLFRGDSFNGDISGWDVSRVANMNGMFSNAAVFNQDISGWDVSNVTDMRGMFSGAAVFNRDISGWDVSNVIDMNSMFSNAAVFNQDISGWNVSRVIDMNSMFSNAVVFNRDISEWDVSNVIDMGIMFSGAAVFNQDISGWDVSSVTNMLGMFFGAAVFNQNINTKTLSDGTTAWDVSKVTDMRDMFRDAVAFNQDISEWDVSNVTAMSYMFSGAAVFNQDINTKTLSGGTTAWDVSKVTNMDRMFYNAAVFNKDISGWDVSKVTNMDYMFRNAVAFKQDLEAWGPHLNGRTVTVVTMFYNSGLSSTTTPPIPSWYYTL